METTTSTVEIKKQRKSPIKKSLNELGKFFTKLRIDLDMTSADWCKLLNVSSSFISSIERDNAKLTFDYALKVLKLVEEKSPQHIESIVVLIADQLGVLVIPKTASSMAVEQAYITLLHYDKQVEEMRSINKAPSYGNASTEDYETNPEE